MKEKGKELQNFQECTLCFLVKEDKILLAMKKRGFGVGKWNGVGGKVKDDENLKTTVQREIWEEISVKPLEFKKVAVLDFLFPEAPRDINWNQRVNVFLVTQWEGEPTESEEMRPQWFFKNKLPFDKMWNDDSLWLLRVLKGEILKGEFTFASDQETIQNYTLKKDK
jgi:8-oxo-dGTP pyrophosphatase MutT (NUDIX family)